MCRPTSYVDRLLRKQFAGGWYGEDPGSASSLYGRYRGAKTGSLVLV